MPKVVITSGYRWSYFQWFLLGFYELKKQGKISLEFRLPLGSFMLTKLSSPLAIRIVNRVIRLWEEDSYNMDGYIISYKNGKKEKRSFSIDSADAPFLFDKEKLYNVDVYFKMQCPIDLEEDGFTLTEGIRIPWCDHKHENVNLKLTERGSRRKIEILPKDKIKPLMVGCRKLSEGISYKNLKSGYDNYIKDRCKNKNKRIMCYFGNAYGPVVEKDPIPDYDWEGDIMGYFGRRIAHPNQKRAEAASIIAKMNQCDARVISSQNADLQGANKNRNLIIPLEQFCKHISQFEWNLNISGYRMSIPNRFVESFIVGTGIVTDKLAVKWYKPFDEEVFETVPMGYLPMEEVDWKKFQVDLEKLPEINSDEVVSEFERKWAPIKAAEYIIDTVLGEKDE